MTLSAKTLKRSRSDLFYTMEGDLVDKPVVFFYGLTERSIRRTMKKYGIRIYRMEVVNVEMEIT